MPLATAAPPESVVIHGTPCCIAARRMARSSKKESLAERGIQDEVDLATFDHVDDVRPSFVDFVDGFPPECRSAPARLPCRAWRSI